jgi:hypothetical protein
VNGMWDRELAPMFLYMMGRLGRDGTGATWVDRTSARNGARCNDKLGYTRVYNIYIHICIYICITPWLFCTWCILCGGYTQLIFMGRFNSAPLTTEPEPAPDNHITHDLIGNQSGALTPCHHHCSGTVPPLLQPRH